MPSVTPPARTPAWQRLGLKLKFAQALGQTSDSPIVIEPLKRNNADTNEHTSLKKSRTHHSPMTTTNEIVTPVSARKKSVTFTPETKVEDGDSIKQLFSAWVAEQKSQDPSFLSKSRQVFDAPEPSKVEEHIDTTLNEKQRRAKRIRRSEESPIQSKEARESKPPTYPKPSKVNKATKASTRPFLEYLKHYYETRETWKFNKNHQNHLLKNVFDVEAIPSDHAHLLYKYVQGLQGGVRTRLRDTAFSIKVKDQEDGAAGFSETMANREKKQQEYEEALKEYVATMTAANASKKMGYEEGVLLGLSDAAMAGRLAKRMRAEQILAELAATGEINDDKIETRIPGPKMTYENEGGEKRLRMNDGSSQKVVRKRKQRTTVADDDTSSSDGSSDSGSSSDEDPVTPPERRARVESSSSSSSSSSSDSSDDDTDDEDEDDGDSDDEESEESDSD